ncbi:NADH-quinone oxidoreductase subunit J [Desulfovibrio sp. OttesenSCG-928-I05]|nr:NADH-quinone oxidoreductase subunit J [Desulfovibrio sp. OttesenSCG-928-I05]
MTVLAYLAFALYFCLIIGGGLMAVFCSNLVRALVGLIATLLGVAGMYLLMQSPFLAFMQILIYVGAVCVIIFFALMMTAGGNENEDGTPIPLGKYARSFLAAIMPLSVLLPVIFLHPVDSADSPVATPLAELGRGLTEDFVLPFELISIILLIAMAGAVFLAWERRNK